MNVRKTYLLFSLLALTGYLWFFVSQQWLNANPAKTSSVCLFKQMSGLPCPSCGSTRAAHALMKGQVADSFQLNPIGTLAPIVLLLFSLGLIRDFLFRKQDVYNLYRRLELRLRQKAVAIPLTLLLLLNWCWNIYKGL